MEIEEYILPYDTPDTPGDAVGYPDVEILKKKTRAVKKSPKVSATEDHEITRKRDILASVALLDGLESYIGENISAIQIRNMKKEKLESYFLLYQEKAGQETTNEMMTSLVEMSVKGLSYVVDIDNQEDLKNDLVNNKRLRRTIGKQVAEITEKYGDFVAITKVLFTVGKHLSFSPAEKDCAGESSTPSTIPVPASTSASTITVGVVNSSEK